MDAPAFEDRHAILNPEQGLLAIDLRQQEPCPAGIARMRGEQLGQSGAERRRQAPALAQPAGETMMFSRFGARGDGSAGDQR